MTLQTGARLLVVLGLGGTLGWLTALLRGARRRRRVRLGSISGNACTLCGGVCRVQRDPEEVRAVAMETLRHEFNAVAAAQELLELREANRYLKDELTSAVGRLKTQPKSGAEVLQEVARLQKHLATARGDRDGWRARAETAARARAQAGRDAHGRFVKRVAP